jgi:hypothetical protein
MKASVRKKTCLKSRLVRSVHQPGHDRIDIGTGEGGRTQGKFSRPAFFIRFIRHEFSVFADAHACLMAGNRPACADHFRKNFQINIYNSILIRSL